MIERMRPRQSESPSLLRTCACAIAARCLASCGDTAPDTSGGPAALRRITQEHYSTIIAGVFGADITM